ncbi:caspase family protein [uncultured Cohaesibacter sp.]|uniref:caspase family protein n=1 Tax=uncultured Cohaesibacter sp. TaxID=1002546 RepID=UPI002AA80621|nr:caspase family protein [uncultured Cohaesibacter sp.]
MDKTLKILCVHGLGDQRQSGWEAKWQNAIDQVIGPDSGVILEYRFVNYDKIFLKTDISFSETVGAFYKLMKSGLGFRRQRGVLSKITDRLRWTAGYVVAWVEDDDFQAQTRKLMLDEVRDFKPDVILAHSLGSLITYNAFSHEDATEAKVARALKKVHYVTFGSQIGNPFVLGNLTNGRVERLKVKHWHHLFNEHDDVFTAQLHLQGADNFNQLLTLFDLPGRGDHDARSYLGHNVTRSSFWSPLINKTLEGTLPNNARILGSTPPWSRSIPKSKRTKKRKALLIGIDDYPKDSDKLFGCANDVYLMSAALQDCGFEPQSIRACLNGRATAEGILSRFEWLVDDAQAGDELVFYYSGHGARVPEYGIYEEPDRMTETLVPYDFDWTPERCVSDEQIFGLYSQLPYDTQMMMVFDCCCSGGIHRQGAVQARGINPPDDIRHRALKWNRTEKMWVERDFAELNRSFARSKTDREKFFGRNKATVRIGRSAPLRVSDEKSYKKAKETSNGPVGPFLPLIIEACGEEEFSYEYRHGANSYGAFTFCLTSILRQVKDVTYEDLVTLATERLERLGYDQKPQILGPSAYMSARVPFDTGTN